MRVYEVSDRVNAGCRITVRPTLGVPMGKSVESGNPVVIPIGSSLGRLLAHPDDDPCKFRLMHGTIDVKAHGIYLVAQDIEKSNADGKAMVWVDICHDQEVGYTRLGASREIGHNYPSLITCTTTDCMMRMLFVFKRNDGIFMSIPPGGTFEGTPKRQVIWWDGQELHQIVRQMPTRPSMPLARPPHLVAAAS